jgi:hypothetical protein
MNVKSKLISNVYSYDRQKAEKWLTEWVDAWVKVGWVCTEWREPSQHEMSATVECEIEVGDDA